MTMLDRSLDGKGTGDGRKPLTGWHVFGYLMILFGAMFIANGFFVYFALSTFSGLDHPSSYKAGRNYADQIEAAQAQATRDWSVSVDIVRSGRGANVELLASDRSRAPVRDVRFDVHIGHPADRRLDMVVPLTVADHGHYRGTIADLAPGNWSVTVLGERDGEPVYKSIERIYVR